MANASINQCKHFVVRKKRNCRMLVKPGEDYCGEHQPAGLSLVERVDTDSKLRIVCPLDRKHTCYAHNLKKHLKICNARQGVSLPYIQKGINSGRAPNCDEIDSYIPLSTFSIEEITNTIVKINRIYNDLIKITDNFSTHKLIEEEMLKPEYGDKTKKHLKQASSILGLLTEYELINPKTCYIEFGAGRGQLTYWLSQATESNDGSFLLVEKSSPKHKRDNKLNKSQDKVQRIRADIADLILDKLDNVEKNDFIVGVTKHLCGEATDLAIRCLLGTSDSHEKVLGCIMAFCCHHRCRWTAYTGREFFQGAGFTKSDFDIMCGISSWAICGTGFSRERRNEEKMHNNERDVNIGLDRHQKEVVGRRAKNIINWGRLDHLEKAGFNCFLHCYVDANVSLENVCIVVVKRKISEI